MDNKTKIIAITGAESTGKSTLTQFLSAKFNAPFCPEIAREYVENLERPYTYEDVETIAKQQIAYLDKLLGSKPVLIFLDTWLIITKIWFEVVFGKKPEWLEDEIKKIPIALFLVCDVDLPWVSDPVRENGGEKRIELHHTYIHEIEKYGFPYRIVSGTGNNRERNALHFVNEIINS